MKPETGFDIGLQEYSMQRMTLEDIEEIQGIYEKCLDFMLLVDGHGADPASES